MRHCIFQESESGKYRTAILVKNTSFNRTDLFTNYVLPMERWGFFAESFIGFDLLYNDKGKAPVAFIKSYLNTLLRALESLGTDTLYCADAAYFKVLTGLKKAETHLGYVKPCIIPGYEHMNVVLGVNHSSLFYNPANQAKLDLSLTTLASHLGEGDTEEIGMNVLEYVDYPSTVEDIETWLTRLLEYPSLTADIEAFSLKHYNAGIGTITFSWNENEAIAFKCDYSSLVVPEEVDVWDKKDKKFKKKMAYGRRVDNYPVRRLLKWFFTNYKGNIKWHNASYDIKVIIYELWMESLIDHEGLEIGLEIMTRDFDCTRLITYLATNSCAGNKLSLKEQAHEFAGNYAQEEINDIRLIEEAPLLEYNAIDGCCTWFVYNKNYPIMVDDQQESLYLGLFKESLINIIRMELTGMPMNMDEVLKGESELQAIHDEHSEAIQGNPFVRTTILKRQELWAEKDYLERLEKSKKPENIHPRDLIGLRNGSVKAPAAFPTDFNPNSGKQIALLLHDILGLPIIETTPSGEPAADDDTLKALKNHTEDESVKELIEHIRMQLGVDKILSTFIPAFKEAQLAPDGIYYLFGSFNLGGTKSGRLSSSNPNLQNLPSGSKYAKVVKKMFQGNGAWVFGGADFNALEDVVNALLTKDPEKLKVLIEGYDGHMYRAVHYWREKFEHLLDYDNLTPQAINALKKEFDKIRSASKPVSFALQYQGTWATLVKNCGFSKEEAQQIEANFHKLYQVSTEYTREKLVEATQKGYVELAYGLRLRTPVLGQTILNTSKTPKEAQAEARTAGNALSGQSYGLINTKAANEFMKRVRAAGLTGRVRLCAQIHDAIYLLMENSLEVIEWCNTHLIECMRNRIEGELPELLHPQVGLNAELDIYRNWADVLTLPNNATWEEIHALAVEHYS